MSRWSYRTRRQLAWLLLIPRIVSAQQNRLVSEGKCYYASGKQANDAYIPCGNSAFGVYACCKNGDNCLSSNACYNLEYDDTYIAGCTDSTYSDPACGYKGAFGDLQWASLVRCFVSDDHSKNDEEWASCYESNQPIVGKHDGGCVCDASAHTAVFTDNPTLTNFAVLPAATGQTISWAPGHTPPSDLTPTAQPTTSTTSTTSTSSTSSIAPTTSSTSESSSPSTTFVSSTTSSTSETTSSSSDENSSTTSTASRTSTTDSSTSTGGAAGASTFGSSASQTAAATAGSGGLSTGAEAGIGVGAGLGVLAICAILFLLYRRRKKKQQYSPQTPSSQPFISPYTDQGPNWSSPPQGQHFQSQVGPGGAPYIRSPAWLGPKPELPTGENSALMGTGYSGQQSMNAPSSGRSEMEGTFMGMGPTPHSGMSRTSPNYSSGGTMQGSSSNSASQGSWIRPVMSANIQNVHELPATHY